MTKITNTQQRKRETKATTKTNTTKETRWIIKYTTIIRTKEKKSKENGKSTIIMVKQKNDKAIRQFYLEIHLENQKSKFIYVICGKFI